MDVLATYPLQALGVTEGFRQEPDVPIITMVRHGESQRKYGCYSRLNTNKQGFKLDERHLDLTEQGITDIQTAIVQLTGLIDKDKEVILVCSSPSARAHSTGLLIDNGLRKNGFNLLNKKGKLKLFRAVNEFAGIIRARSIVTLGVTEGDRQIVELYFQRFLRHMNNLYAWMQPTSRARLQGKRLRIICAAHAETSGEFIFKSMSQSATYQSKGQIFEITPCVQLAVNSQVLTRLRLLPNQSRTEGYESLVLRGFQPTQAK